MMIASNTEELRGKQGLIYGTSYRPMLPHTGEASAAYTKSRGSESMGHRLYDGDGCDRSKQSEILGYCSTGNEQSIGEMLGLNC